MAHTPAPWAYDHESGEVVYEDREDENIRPRIATVDLSNTEADSQAYFDGLLIAAAPDLLAALREFDRLSLVIESAARNQHQVNASACARIVAAILAARTAIAKAESGNG